MSETSEKKSKPSKDPRGGPRKGAGRPKGAKSARTIARERRIRQAVQDALAEAPSPEIEEADPFTALEFALRTYWRSGDLAGMVAVAKEMLPYTRPKMASAEPVAPLPADLEPDPEPVPDEPVPGELTE